MLLNCHVHGYMGGVVLERPCSSWRCHLFAANAASAILVCRIGAIGGSGRAKTARLAKTVQSVLSGNRFHNTITINSLLPLEIPERLWHATCFNPHRSVHGSLGADRKFRKSLKKGDNKR